VPSADTACQNPITVLKLQGMLAFSASESLVNHISYRLRAALQTTLGVAEDARKASAEQGRSRREHEARFIVQARRVAREGPAICGKRQSDLVVGKPGRSVLARG
jgi:hypothetical protein